MSLFSLSPPLLSKHFFLPVNYVISSEANASLIPSLSLTMKGNSHFTINDPIIVISTEVIHSSSLCSFLYHFLSSSTEDLHFSQGELVYCLAIVKSSELNIIGRKNTFASFFSWILEHPLNSVTSRSRLFTL